MNKKEIDYYQEIALELVRQFESNLNNKDFKVKPLIGEISSALRTLIVNGFKPCRQLLEYSKSIHKLYLDISILVENPQNGKFELIIFELKKVNNLGLSELSQLIGYCLVSKSKFGILINVDKAVSRNFSLIIDSDKDLTNIIRIIESEKIEHKFGIMIWNSSTLKIEYTNSGSIKSIPELIEIIENIIK